MTTTKRTTGVTTLMILAAAIAAATLTACMPAAPDGPAGRVTAHTSPVICTGKPLICRHKYRIVVQPASGQPVTVRVYRSEQQACQVGEQYPACLPTQS